MYRRYFCLFLVVVYTIFLYVPFSQAESMSYTEAINIISEYLMQFDKYSGQELLDISGNEYHPAFSYLYFGYSDATAPLENYTVLLASNENGDPIVLKSISNDYVEPIYVFFCICGSGDIAFPMLVVNGKNDFGKPIKKMVLRSGTAEYSIEYKDNQLSFNENGEFSATCMTMFEMQIDLLMQMAQNNDALEIEITFEGGKKVSTVTDPVASAQGNKTLYYLQALEEAYYIDKNGKIQADLVSLFPSLLSEWKKSVIVTNTQNKNDKGFSLFGEKYGLTLTSNGESGVSSSHPWFVANVKNESSDKTVDGFDLVYYGTSVYGDVLELDHDGAKLMYYTVVKDIKPSQTHSTEKIYFSSSTQKPKRIYVAIRKIHFSDGTCIEIPLRDLFFYEFSITY